MSVVEDESQEEKDCSQLLQVVGDKTRLAILRQLLKADAHVGELNRDLAIEQSLLSHHLRVLRENGLVISRRDGKSVLYSLNRDARGGDLRRLELGCCHIDFPIEE